MSLTNTPRANRLHIGIFGRRNSGKSSLINAITMQDTALVSSTAGTTTDPVYKAMEINPIGPCVFIDTAGFDDTGDLGGMRIERTKEALEKTDIGIVVFADTVSELEISWIKELQNKNVPYIPIINKIDEIGNIDEIYESVKRICSSKPILVSARERIGIEELLEAIKHNMPNEYELSSITGELAKEGDTVLLVMPQDIQAPKGRLILPQVQTIRELLDKKCLVLSSTADKLNEALSALSKPPKLIITDSQAFKAVYDKKPAESKLTSFSILFANYKGDLEYYIEGAKSIETLTESSHVLIAEACTHAPLEEDIGRVKIPGMLRKKVGEKLNITIVSGVDFPKNLNEYDLIIHCGACMFNRKYVLGRINMARQVNVAMSNYGVVIAYLNGILDKIDWKVN